MSAHYLKPLSRLEKCDSDRSARKNMNEINNINLFLVAIGIINISIALHYKQPDKNIKYGWRFGFVENLTTKGKIMFIFGIILTIIGCLVEIPII